MRSYILKFFLGLGFVLLIYFIGIQGCSLTQHWAGLETVDCEEIEEIFGRCNVERVLGPPEEEREDRDQGRDRGRRSGPGKEISARTPPPGRAMCKNFDYTVPTGKVDIIFVIDNSSSMAVEHREIAGQFNSFLHNLRDVDYHIAVITTDISRSPDNPFQDEYWQDGKFIPIGRRIFLRNENKGQRISNQTLKDFQRAIEREETTRCDQENQQQSSRRNRYDFDDESSSIRCPSHDERGTYALNLAIRNSVHQRFFRRGAHLMVVILSDEDIRSGEPYYSQPGFEEYEFEDYDYPEVLMESISNRFGKLKSVSFYPIIIPPGNAQCLREQNRKRKQGEGTGGGYYGVEYARLAMAEDDSLTKYGNLLEGEIISICRKGYSSQLNRVAMSANTARIALPCGNPDEVKLYVDGQRQRRVKKRIEGRTLILDPGQIRLGADAKVEVCCPE